MDASLLNILEQVGGDRIISIIRRLGTEGEGSGGGLNIEVLDEVVGQGGITISEGLESVVTEVLVPARRVVVFGAGHVGAAVAMMSGIVGFDVLVIDDREVFASKDRFPHPNISVKAGDYKDEAKADHLRSGDAVVIVTRGHQFDEICLRGVIHSRAGYIGMIGSRRRVISVFDRLTKDGYARVDLDRVHAPIGLRIDARSPQEIAVAILAEIIACFNKMEVGRN